MIDIVISALVSAFAGAIAGAVVGGVFTRFKALPKKLVEERKREEAERIGVQALLRAEIIRQHDKYMERGCCPIYAKESIKQEYEAYHGLGGNGVATKLYNDIMSLPEVRP